MPSQPSSLARHVIHKIKSHRLTKDRVLVVLLLFRSHDPIAEA